MARKRVERATSDVRYMIKMFKHHGVPVPEDLERELTRKMWAERQGQWANYKRVWEAVKKVLAAEGIPTVMYVAYRAAAFEYYNKVLLTHDKPPEAWYDKWERRGLDPRILTTITTEVEKAVGTVTAS